MYHQIKFLHFLKNVVCDLDCRRYWSQDNAEPCKTALSCGMLSILTDSSTLDCCEHPDLLLFKLEWHSHREYGMLPFQLLWCYQNGSLLSRSEMTKERTSFLNVFQFYQASELLPSWTAIWKTRFALCSSQLVAPECFDVNRRLSRLKRSHCQILHFQFGTEVRKDSRKSLFRTEFIACPAYSLH